MNFISLLQRIFFPEKCPLCGKLLNFNESVCPSCKSSDIRLSASFCHGCGQDTDKCICSEERISLSHIAAVYVYTGLSKARIHEFKFRGKKSLGKVFGDEMSFRVSECFYDADFDLVSFVPLSKARQKERGYNQSEILAKQISKRLFIPCEKLLEKTAETKKQHELSAKERMSNLNNAFSLSKDADIKGKTVLLCDDVKTTGATLKECEKLLLKSGAKDVYCICIALSDYGDIFPILDKPAENY